MIRDQESLSFLEPNRQGCGHEADTAEEGHRAGVTNGVVERILEFMLEGKRHSRASGAKLPS